MENAEHTIIRSDTVDEDAITSSSTSSSCCCCSQETTLLLLLFRRLVRILLVESIRRIVVSCILLDNNNNKKVVSSCWTMESSSGPNEGVVYLLWRSSWAGETKHEVVRVWGPNESWDSDHHHHVRQSDSKLMEENRKRLVESSRENRICSRGPLDL